jgi:hypothetical protein
LGPVLVHDIGSLHHQDAGLLSASYAVPGFFAIARRPNAALGVTVTTISEIAGLLRYSLCLDLLAGYDAAIGPVSASSQSWPGSFSDAQVLLGVFFRPSSCARPPNPLGRS